MQNRREKKCLRIINSVRAHLCEESSDEREELNAVSSPVHIYICVGGACAHKQAVMSLTAVEARFLFPLNQLPFPVCQQRFTVNRLHTTNSGSRCHEFIVELITQMASITVIILTFIKTDQSVCDYRIMINTHSV